ncbi:Rne/Rng family ribonuclease [Bradyrhizobium sp. U87765 SZCCT0131]|uniref:ribonuclease E/G n=1 Tax=unclassified Bradyrhizobium TaxID=2631580 RepID=UPI001BA6CD36|nr:MULTISPECIES: ribonuclease E/G [unclassified Bradyrhizobium]MBR1220362.1 Rne/Rng family ribonuclease [Bradyrhizobium sp. U87765 SZCCT0131]MBR1263183.1 Rne/Rng family ribonuclease [Bradyrhizobium sp. U87765 SZCCT0134]MBR1306934.1 Rne/Rng family ribonuclease [Bradyrhizobium sp. U87765 SZCCT0110]MBR1323433.1 Rne/Rng family ribonuclease [Bradyrhizobium sp. U87765 SZCCT0109]MBR1345888.1 Rne/Rng family ribonuclease [Bradyrhizobium sp. U87765 SZCCT0048]
MPNKMLIDATHPEETRVVVVRGNRVEEFDFESAQRKQLRGNIYLAKVTRVEPSLQAAFIEYGGNRHGFLAFSEIHPDYYQIPVADRQALIEADERAHREAEEESESRPNRRRSRHRGARRRGHGERVRSEIVEGAAVDPANAPQPFEHDGHDHPHDAPHGESLAHGDDHHDHDHEHHDHDGHAHHDDHGHDDHGHDDHHEPAPQVETAPAIVSGTTETVAHDAPALEAHHDDAPAVTAEADTRADEAHDAHEHHADDDHEHHGDDHHDDDHHDEPAGVPTHAHDDAEDGDDEEDDEDEETAEEEAVESVGGDDALEEVPERPFRPRRQYKIQEVIKRRQVMLVQVVKEERGNKGAALTTYLSLAGRYAVLMPNTARGGGISRKITSAQDRSRLKEVVQDLDVPEGMGVILRTAGASRTKPEIKRDFEYLIRMWETVRDLTLRSQAPNLVYEEGSLIKRSLRDLYNKEIDEIQVAGEAGYREAHDFMKMLMPTHTRAVKLYRDGQPLFSRMGVESQLDAMFSPTVQLRSGGYIVINQTEALVSIDVNSGRSTREHHIEDTALKTNLEAAEEIARQLRLRDLAGLIVIDFIDMDEKRNNRSVERKLSDCLRHDRARIQVGRISHFGLLEMSRQRIRASVLESSTEPCPHCGGTGHVRSVASVALQLLRGLEEVLMKGATHNLVVRTRTEVALYVLNHKRGHLRDLENSFKVTLSVIADPTVSGQQSFVIDRGEQVHTLEAAKALLAAQAAATPPAIEEPFDDEELEGFAEDEGEDAEDGAETQASDDNAEGDGGRRRRRRRRRRGRGGERGPASQGEDQDDNAAVAAEGEGFEVAEGDDTGSADEDGDERDESEERDGFEARSDQGERRPRRRGRRGGRRRRGGPEGGHEGSEGHDATEGHEALEGSAAAIADEFEPTAPSEAAAAVADLDAPAAVPAIAEREAQTVAEPSPAAVEHVAASAEADPLSDDGDKRKRRSTIREKVNFFDASAEAAPAPPAAEPVHEATASDAVAPESHPEPAVEHAAPATASEESSDNGQTPRRAGWWSRRFGGGA